MFSRLATENIPLPLYDTFVYVEHKLEDTGFGVAVHGEIMDYWGEHARVWRSKDFKNPARLLLQYTESSMSRDSKDGGWRCLLGN